MSRRGTWMEALEQRHRARFRVSRHRRGPIAVPGGMATFIAGAGVFCAVTSSLEIHAAWGGDEASAAVVRTWTDAKGTGYANVDFRTSSGQRVRTSIEEGAWVERPKAGERVRVWYKGARPADSAVDARRPGQGPGWQVHGLIWLVNLGVFGTFAYRSRVKKARARDLVVRRSPTDAPPLQR